MNKIESLLSDPSWWFTTVIVGMITSVAAPYLKDLIVRAVAIFSKSVARRRDEKKKKQIAQVNYIATHEMVLIVNFFSITIKTLCFVTMTVMMELSTLKSDIGGGVIFLVLAGVFFLASMYLGYIISSQLRATTAAWIIWKANHLGPCKDCEKRPTIPELCTYCDSQHNEMQPDSTKE